MFRKLQLLLNVPEFLSNPLSPDRFLARLPGVTRPRHVLEIAFNQTRKIKEEDNINCGPTFLTNAVFQSPKHMSTFKEVVVVLQYKAARSFGLHQSQENWKVAWARIFQETANGLSTSPGGNQEFGSAKCIPFDEAFRSYSTDHPSSCHWFRPHRLP